MDMDRDTGWITWVEGVAANATQVDLLRHSLMLRQILLVRRVGVPWGYVGCHRQNGVDGAMEGVAGHRGHPHVCTPKPCSGWKCVMVTRSGRSHKICRATRCAIAPFRGPSPVSTPSATRSPTMMPMLGTSGAGV